MHITFLFSPVTYFTLLPPDLKTYFHLFPHSVHSQCNQGYSLLLLLSVYALSVSFNACTACLLRNVPLSLIFSLYLSPSICIAICSNIFHLKQANKELSLPPAPSSVAGVLFPFTVKRLKSCLKSLQLFLLLSHFSYSMLASVHILSSMNGPRVSKCSENSRPQIASSFTNSDCLSLPSS